MFYVESSSEYRLPAKENNRDTSEIFLIPRTSQTLIRKLVRFTQSEDCGYQEYIDFTSHIFTRSGKYIGGTLKLHRFIRVLLL
jgi:hypothetical protein